MNKLIAKSLRLKGVTLYFTELAHPLEKVQMTFWILSYPYISALMLHGTYPVSYTHLDVYKRQHSVRNVMEEFANIFNLSSGQ